LPYTIFNFAFILFHQLPHLSSVFFMACGRIFD
jgi:hypothetical protein